MAVKNAHTVLVMAGIGVPPYSARGLKQTLGPLDQASQLRRTANGALKDISFSGFKKFKSTISGTDQEPPSFDGKWPGLTVTVDCISELQYLTSGGSPARPVVAGSSRVSGLFTIYRPQLTMKIINFNIDQDEYQRDIGWTLDLEEI